MTNYDEIEKRLEEIYYEEVELGHEKIKLQEQLAK